MEQVFKYVIIFIHIEIALLNLPVEPPRRAEPTNHPFFLTAFTEFSVEAIPNFGVNGGSDDLKKEAA